MARRAVIRVPKTPEQREESKLRRRMLELRLNPDTVVPLAERLRPSRGEHFRAWLRLRLHTLVSGRRHEFSRVPGFQNAGGGVRLCCTRGWCDFDPYYRPALNEPDFFDGSDE